MTTLAKSRFPRWADLDMDILLRIFMTLNVMDLISASRVCTTWRQASSEPSVWKTMDLSKLEFSDFEPGESNRSLMAFLNSMFSLSSESISSLKFLNRANITSQIFVLVSQRTPNLKRLVLPSLWEIEISNTVFEDVAKNWPNLESLTLDENSITFFKVIAKHCSKLYRLELKYHFTEDFAETILDYTPNLRVLCLRATAIERDFLLDCLEEMNHLRVLDLTHSVILDDYTEEPGHNVIIFDEPDDIILKMASHLEKFLYCQRSSCRLCHDLSSDDYDSIFDGAGHERKPCILKKDNFYDIDLLFDCRVHTKPLRLISNRP